MLGQYESADAGLARCVAKVAVADRVDLVGVTLTVPGIAAAVLITASA
jgi:hypothetical protein